jgi:hypothetical protein
LAGLLTSEVQGGSRRSAQFGQKSKYSFLKCLRISGHSAHRAASYLNGVERYKEAIVFCRTAVARADPAERPRLLNAWVLAIDASGDSTREALALQRAAVKLQPDL